jgi:hypothetical protein
MLMLLFLITLYGFVAILKIVEAVQGAIGGEGWIWDGFLAVAWIFIIISIINLWWPRKSPTKPGRL